VVRADIDDQTKSCLLRILTAINDLLQ